jgi:hypothetical protein
MNIAVPELQFRKLFWSYFPPLINQIALSQRGMKNKMERRNKSAFS